MHPCEPIKGRQDAGDIAPGEPMYGFTEDAETIIQLHGTGPWGIEYVHPEDDPRK